MIDIVQVAASGVSDFFWLLDFNQITALATAVSALFAGTIFWINWIQLKQARNVERAYISGGGPLDANDLNKFLFTVNNYGKTPVILTEYAVEFCSLTDIRSVPAYGNVGTNAKHFTSIPPGEIKETRVVASIDIPPLTRPSPVYGRYWYADI